MLRDQNSVETISTRFVEIDRNRDIDKYLRVGETVERTRRATLNAQDNKKGLAEGNRIFGRSVELVR